MDEERFFLQKIRQNPCSSVANFLSFIFVSFHSYSYFRWQVAEVLRTKWENSNLIAPEEGLSVNMGEIPGLERFRAYLQWEIPSLRGTLLKRRVEMRQMCLFVVLLVGSLAMQTPARAGTTLYDQGFEVDTAGWFDIGTGTISRVASGGELFALRRKTAHAF